jgi:restriction endonuclease S subunit
MTNSFDLKNIDKSNWKTVRFDKIALKISKRVNPNTTDLKVYVGLEHLDAESIHIRRYGTPADVKGEKLRCKPGDVIFGKRRAYQRKAAIADFDGICSAHAFVLRANPDVIDPKLFPFFLHSDAFMHRMVDISVGGLSPTINWKNLKGQEFLLPPKDQQAKIAQLLWALDKVVEKEVMVLGKLEIYQESLIKFHFQKADFTQKIKHLGKIITGSTPSTKNDKYWGNKIPFISPAEIEDSIYTKTTKRFLSSEGAKKSRLLPPNSVLTVCIGSIGKIAINKKEACSNQQINALIPNENYSPIYLLFLLRYHKSKILARAGQTVLPIINKSEFEEIKLPILNQTLILKFEQDINVLLKSKRNQKSKLQTSKNLQKSLINQIF